MSEAAQVNPRIERRVVVVDEGERSRVIADGPSSEVITDPARPGFRSALLWVTDSSPVRLKDVREGGCLYLDSPERPWGEPRMPSQVLSGTQGSNGDPPGIPSCEPWPTTG